MNSSVKEEMDFSQHNADQDLVQPAPQTSRFASQEREFTAEDYRTVLRLLVGSALEGNDELRSRIKSLRNSIEAGDQDSVVNLQYVDRTGGSSLLYAVLGLLFKTPNYLSKGASTTGRLTSRASGLGTRLIKPISNSRLIRPVHRRYKYLVARGESVVNSLEILGRTEARSSRALVHQQATDQMVEEIVSDLVEKVKLREVIAEQSVGAATDVSTEIRQRSAAVDSSLDNFVDNLLRRKKAKSPASG